MLPDSVRYYLDNCKNSERGAVLRALAELTERTGFASAVDAIDLAIQYEAHDVDSLKNLYRRIYTDIPELPDLPKQAGVPNITPINSVNLTAYDAFLERRHQNG